MGELPGLKGRLDTMQDPREAWGAESESKWGPTYDTGEDKRKTSTLV